MATYETVITDPFTGEQALIKSNDYNLSQQRIQSKKNAWEKRGAKLEGLEKAEALTLKAEQDSDALIDLLYSSLDNYIPFDLDSLKDREEFFKFKFKAEEPPIDYYMWDVPKKSIFEKLFKSLKTKREKLEKEANEKYLRDLVKYNEEKESAIKQYETEKSEYIKKQEEHNDSVDILKDDFEKNVPEAIEKYLEYTLTGSLYPEFITLNYDILYIPDRRTIVLEVDLPNPEHIPNVIEFKYIASRKEIIKKELKKKEFQDLYESVVSQIAIRTIYETYVSVDSDAADFVVFNGFVETIDKRTGKNLRNCILSIQAEKSYFLSLNLRLVNPRECIKGMKGLIASEFINLAPVRPILNLNRTDRRIIESDGVIDGMDPTNNLADMDWQKFEVLVRDLFQKEFSGEGVEVKVTQASRDAGVDGIIFDPDPIKGGKFIIQAKRYNNIVGVGAVRDLYGTVVNEGAVKGILVTTSNYGKDSIDFAKDKPLTLINGAELVYLFNKHGYHVNIKTHKSKPT